VVAKVATLSQDFALLASFSNLPSQEGTTEKFEITLEDGTVIFSGEAAYKSSRNLRDKYPTGPAVVQMLQSYRSSQP
jgi:hypothetical protein